MDKDAVKPVQNLWASSTFLCSKTTQPLETCSRSEQTKPFGDHQDHPPTRGVGYLNRFQGRLLPYTNTGTVQEISEILCPGSDIPVQRQGRREWVTSIDSGTPASIYPYKTIQKKKKISEF